jgi:hypothetical protein
LKATNAGPDEKNKRHDNNKKYGPKNITCTVCQKTDHKDEDCCFDTENIIRDADLALAKSKDESEPILNTKTTTDSQCKLTAGVVTTTSNSSVDSTYSLTCQLPESHVPISSESVCTTTLFVPDTKESILDRGTMSPIIEDTQVTGSRVRLVGVTDTGVDAELADVIFPVHTTTHELYAIDDTGEQTGSTLLVERTKDTILSLDVFLKGKFKVDFTVGTEEDPSFGGILRTPEGHTINLMFRVRPSYTPSVDTPFPEAKTIFPPFQKQKTHVKLK